MLLLEVIHVFVEVNNTNFCKNIRYLRRKKRFSKKILAAKAGISVAELEQIECEPALLALDYETLLRFRMILNCSLDTLFNSDLSKS